MTVARRAYADEIFGALEKAGVPVHHEVARLVLERAGLG